MNRAYLLQELKCTVTEIVELQEKATLTQFSEVRRIQKTPQRTAVLKLVTTAECIANQQTA